MVVLNSQRAATEILDRRANIYSDRPSAFVANDILCSGLLLPLIRYNETCVASIVDSSHSSPVVLGGVECVKEHTRH